MTDTGQIETVTIRAGGFDFTASACGPTDGDLVLLLHGFPQSRYSYVRQLPVLAAAGFRAVAPDQRGYSPGARPADVESYVTDELVADVLRLVDALGHERFHLVGHDWGGQVAWLTAAQHPDSVRSLVALSRPHPAAFAQSLQQDTAQSDRSKHHRRFLDPDTVGLLLADDARRLREMLETNAVPPESVTAYLEVLADPAALEGAVNWYRAGLRDGRASVLAGPNVASVTVPTTYIWGTADMSVGRTAAEATAAFVTGPYRFAELAGVNHFATDEAPEFVNEILTVHLRDHA